MRKSDLWNIPSDVFCYFIEFIHPCVHYLSPLILHSASYPSYQTVKAEYTVNKLSFYQTADTERQASTLIITPEDNPESQIDPTCTLLNCGRKLEYLQKNPSRHREKLRTSLLWGDSTRHCTAVVILVQVSFKLKSKWNLKWTNKVKINKSQLTNKVIQSKRNKFVLQ